MGGERTGENNASIHPQDTGRDNPVPERGKRVGPALLPFKKLSPLLQILNLQFRIWAFIPSSHPNTS
jgi:hypothetical protein